MLHRPLRNAQRRRRRRNTFNENFVHRKRRMEIQRKTSISTIRRRETQSFATCQRTKLNKYLFTRPSWSRTPSCPPSVKWEFPSPNLSVCDENKRSICEIKMTRNELTVWQKHRLRRKQIPMQSVDHVAALPKLNFALNSNKHRCFVAIIARYICATSADRRCSRHSQIPEFPKQENNDCRQKMRSITHSLSVLLSTRSISLRHPHRNRKRIIYSVHCIHCILSLSLSCSGSPTMTMTLHFRNQMAEHIRSHKLRQAEPQHTNCVCRQLVVSIVV